MEYSFSLTQVFLSIATHVKEIAAMLLAKAPM
jgi:hypothetical protein